MLDVGLAIVFFPLGPSPSHTVPSNLIWVPVDGGFGQPGWSEQMEAVVV